MAITVKGIIGWVNLSARIDFAKYASTVLDLIRALLLAPDDDWKLEPHFVRASPDLQLPRWTHAARRSIDNGQQFIRTCQQSQL